MRGKQTGKGRESKENQGIDGGQGRLAEITEWRGFQNNEAGLTRLFICSEHCVKNNIRCLTDSVIVVK